MKGLKNGEHATDAVNSLSVQKEADKGRSREDRPRFKLHFMMNCCNTTVLLGWDLFCPLPHKLALFGVLGIMLAVSLSVNIFCCVAQCCSGKGACRRKSQDQRQMEENPIYGNISFMEDVSGFSDGELQYSSMRFRQGTKPQDCYANLSLKPPRPQSGRSSPQTQMYSDDVLPETVVTLEPEKEDGGNTDAVSTISDLYASVQTQRTKTMVTADTGEDYANHL